MSNDEVIVQDWERVNGFKVPFNLHKVIKPEEKLRHDRSSYGPLYDLTNFASKHAGAHSIFADEERGIGAFSFSLQDFTGCGRSSVTSFLYVAKRDENILKARLTDYATFEGTPYHYDSIHYFVENLDEHEIKGGIYRLGLPRGIKLDEFKVHIE